MHVHIYTFTHIHIYSCGKSYTCWVVLTYICEEWVKSHISAIHHGTHMCNVACHTHLQSESCHAYTHIPISPMSHIQEWVISLMECGTSHMHICGVSHVTRIHSYEWVACTIWMSESCQTIVKSDMSRIRAVSRVKHIHTYEEVSCPICKSESHHTCAKQCVSHLGKVSHV